MIIDIAREIDAVQREVGEGRIAGVEARTIRLQRDFDAPIDDVWDALTNPERIGRWFLPISGDYRLGGRYQFEGNAGGEILACDRPNLLKASWLYGEPTSDDAALGSRDPAVDRRRWSDPARFPTHGGRAGRDVEPVRAGRRRRRLGRGVVGAHPSSPRRVDRRPAGLAAVGRGTRFSTRSSEAWGEASRASGTDPETVALWVANSTAFYVPEPDAAP